MKTYPSASYHRLFDPSVGQLWSPAQGLDPAEDADHYSPERDFFEWWYFDAVFENGWRMVAILHSSLYNAVDHKPTVDIRLTPPQGDSVLAIGRYPRSAYQASNTHCDVRIAGCRAVQEPSGAYRLTLDEGGVSVELLYQPLAPGWRPGTGYLFLDPSTGHYFKWVVPLPLARVAGVLKLGEQSLSVQGTGYHDHNWGNFVLADAFSHWYWGRFLASHPGETWSLVFGDVVGRGSDPQTVRPFLLIGGGTFLDDHPNLFIQTNQMLREPHTGVSYPSCLELDARSDRLHASLSLRSGRVMEALHFANPPFRSRLPRQLAEAAFYLSAGKPLLGSLSHLLLGKASYLRMEAQARLDVHQPGPIFLTGSAVYEIMQF